MSNIYNLEPPTKGKVTLHTTLGDLDIELWPKEAPKAVRNFVQLCLEGYYDGCIFHRVIKDFMAQTGDPTGTGSGGDTIYNGPFRDEFHSRLRFAHRGLVAAANQNAKHTNGSQFFITLDKTEWLNNQNTIFGKIVGDTIYNMLRFNDLEVDEATDRPTDPPFITSVEVLWNPFEDIVPRTTPQERRAQEQFQQAEASRKERKGRKRNLALLSFRDDAEAEEAEAAAAAASLGGGKIRSAHEVLKGDAKLLAPEETPEEVLAEQRARSAALAAVQQRLGGAGGRKNDGGGGSSSGVSSDSDDDGGRRGSQRRREQQQQPSAAALVAQRVKAATDKAERANAGRSDREAAVAAAAAAAAAAEPARKGRSRSRSASRGGSRSRSRSGDRQQQQPDKAAAAGDDLYAVKSKSGPGKLVVDASVADGELLKEFELSRQKYKKRKEQVGSRQKDTMAKLAAFTSKLRASGSTAAAAGKAPAAAAAAAAAAGGGDDDEAYDGKVRTDIDHRAYMPAAWRVDEYLGGGGGKAGDGGGSDGDNDDPDLSSLRQHKLEFSKAPQVGDAMARRDDLDDYEVHDPLLEKAKGKFSKAAQAAKKKETAWATRR